LNRKVKKASHFTADKTPRQRSRSPMMQATTRRLALLALSFPRAPAPARPPREECESSQSYAQMMSWNKWEKDWLLISQIVAPLYQDGWLIAPWCDAAGSCRKFLFSRSGPILWRGASGTDARHALAFHSPPPCPPSPFRDS
jgi:hypothetical protein